MTRDEILKVFCATLTGVVANPKFDPYEKESVDDALEYAHLLITKMANADDKRGGSDWFSDYLE